MKKLLSVLLAFIFTAISAFSFSASAVTTVNEFKYQIITESEVVLVEYLGDGTDVIIPNKFGTYFVTSIAANVFSGNTKIISVKLPENLKSIGYGAFMGCTSLKTVYLPGTLTNLDYNVFYQCDAIKTVIFCGTSARRYAINASDGNESVMNIKWYYHSYSVPWNADNIKHWHQCDVCNKPQNTGEHRDINSDGICDICLLAFTVICGDANGDESINSKDLARIKKYLAGFDTDISKGADCDGDGSITAKDLTRLKKYIAGLPVTLGPEEQEPEIITPTTPDSLKWEEYCALSAEEKDDYLNSYSDINDFYAWMAQAKETYRNEHPDIEIGDDTSIDFSNLP